MLPCRTEYYAVKVGYRNPYPLCKDIQTILIQHCDLIYVAASINQMWNNNTSYLEHIARYCFPRDQNTRPLSIVGALTLRIHNNKGTLQIQWNKYWWSQRELFVTLVHNLQILLEHFVDVMFDMWVVSIRVGIKGNGFSLFLLWCCSV